MRAAVSSAIAIVLLTAVFGFAYPLVMTGFAQVAFKGQANGSLIKVDGAVVGSKLAAQEFTSRKYFHERPSAVSYNAMGTSFANLGPTNPDLAKNVASAAKTILKLEGPYNAGLTIHDITSRQERKLGKSSRFGPVRVSIGREFGSLEGFYEGVSGHAAKERGRCHS